MSRETGFLDRQQCLLDMKPAAVATNGSVMGYDPVAWDDQSYGVFSASLPDCTICFRLAYSLRDVTIGSGFAKRDITEGLPHFFLKRSPALNIQWKHGQWHPVGQKLENGAPDSFQQWDTSFTGRLQTSVKLSKVPRYFIMVGLWLAMEVESADAPECDGNDDPAQGGGKTGEVIEAVLNHLPIRNP